MSHATTNNRIRQQGWNSPWLPPESSASNGANLGQTSCYPDVSQRSDLLTEEFGLTLVSPGRLRTLLVPLDGGPIGEHALPHALAIARQAGAAVRLVHVPSPGTTLPSNGISSATGRQRSQKWQWKNYLNDLFLRLEKVSSVPIIPVFLNEKDVADALRVEARDVDLIVMATHKRWSPGRFWRGGITTTLMRQLPIPQLLVPGQKILPELNDYPSVRHVLIPLDGTRDAERVAEPATALGSLWNAQHTLLRVIRWTLDYSVGYGGVSARPLIDLKPTEVWDYFRRVSDRLQSNSHRIRSRTLYTVESIAEAILWYARRHGADLIALTPRTRGWLARLIRGSVTDQVIRGARVPVLVLPPDLDEGKG